MSLRPCLPSRSIPLHLFLLGIVLSMLCGQVLAEMGRIELQGLEGEVRENALAMLSLADEPCDAPRWRVKRRLEDADREIGTALRAFGLYRPKITKQLAWDKDCWRAHIEVEPGPPVEIGTFDLVIEGDAAADPEFQWVRSDPGIRPGDLLHHDRYEALKQRLRDLASERGYFRARFVEKRLEVDPDRLSARIRLVFDSGPRFRIGALKIDATPYDPLVLSRLLTLKEGEPYSAGALQKNYRALADSGYFERVDITPDLDQLGGDSVPIHVGLQLRKRHAYKLGLGVSSDLGPKVSGRYENRRINRFGHRLQLELNLSPVRSDGGLEYLIPLYGSHWRQLSLQAGVAHEDTDSARSDTLTASARLAGRRGRWDETPFLELQQERSTVEGQDIDSTLLMPGIRWERRRVDDLLRPRSGESLALELRGAMQGLLSDTSFVQAWAEAKAIRPLGVGKGIARLELGTIQGADFSALPASRRFFAGGDRSIRGYAYESLSPRDSNGTLSGGAHLLVASLEYEHPVAKDWGVAGFVDTGNAFDSLSEGFRTGVGLGVRWYSPVGPIKVDVGFPQSDSTDTYRLHFSFGTGL